MSTISHAIADLELGPFTAKPTSLVAGQVEAALQLWQGTGGVVSVGVWECSPGTFTANRDDHSEVCVLVSGSATITPDGEPPRLLQSGDVLVMAQGWTGTWEVHEPVRKVYFLVADH